VTLAPLLPRVLVAAGLLLSGSAVVAQTTAAPTYDVRQATQYDPSPAADTIPRDPAARQANAAAIASEATVYGLPAVLQYGEMFAQALDRSNKRFVGFNRFAHDRSLAGPDYAAFKSPNSDTLYSNGWLDLTRGPVLIDIPPVPLRYYTLNFFDAYGNASNIGTRTYGSKGGRFLVAPVAWHGVVPAGATLFRVATPHAWVLMRIFAQKPSEVGLARALQDRVTITLMGDEQPADTRTSPSPLGAKDDALTFMAVLDAVLRENGHPLQEDGLVARFRSIGVGAAKPFDAAALDAETRAGIAAGYASAMAIIRASRAQLGIPTGTGWNRIEKGRYGTNYLNRATINFVGLGANVSDENFSFNTFADGSGKPLDGASNRYTLRIAPPPPVNGFWSVTLYDAATYRLFPNPIARYLINDRTAGVKRAADNSLTLLIQHAKPRDPANWLPAPAGPFYLAFRAYLPQADLLAGRWVPNGVTAIPLAAKP